MELRYPMTIATAAVTGRSGAAEPATDSGSQEGRHEQTHSTVTVEVNHAVQSVPTARRRRDDGEEVVHACCQTCTRKGSEY